MMYSVFDRVRRPLCASLMLALAPLAAAVAQQPKPQKPQAPRAGTLTDFAGMETFSIMDIQGDQMFSPLAGQRVETSGIVTLLTKDRRSFWIQDPKGDGNAATSDGLFVTLGRQPQVAERPEVGDVVRVIGFVEEELRDLSLPRTRLKDLVKLEIVGRGKSLPAPVPLVDVPDLEIPQAIAFWEGLEGMRVSLDKGKVVGPTNRYGEWVVLAESNAKAGSGYHPDAGVMLTTDLGNGRVDYNPERIPIGSATLDKRIVARLGDEVENLVGVLDFTFSKYRVQPESLEMKTQEPPSAPASRRSGPPGDVKVVSYNLRDLFDGVDNPDRFDENYDPGSRKFGTPSPEELEARLGKHALAVIQELELPDLIVTQEFETTELIQQISDRVNAQVGARYKAVSLETSDRRGLEVGFVYDEARVELIEYYQMSGPEVAKTFGLESHFRTREPLVGVFRFSPGGPPVTVIACKFKSKRTDGPLFQVNPRRVRVTERQRKAQSRLVREFVNSILDKDAGAMVMVVGDLGDYQFGEPDEGEHAAGILSGNAEEVPLVNLVDREEPAEAYTYLFQGNGVALSHILVSPKMLERLAAVDYLHFNSPFPEDGLRYEPSTPLRASDRDPIEARFDLRNPPGAGR